MSSRGQGKGDLPATAVPRPWTSSFPASQDKSLGPFGRWKHRLRFRGKRRVSLETSTFHGQNMATHGSGVFRSSKEGVKWSACLPDALCG